MLGEVKCEVCLEEDASRACSMCGRLVCSNHYVESKGRCVVCDEAICRLCGSALSIGYCIFCGREICEDCSVEVDEIRYACVECAKTRPNPSKT